MQISRAGDRALLVDVGDVSAATLHGLAAQARALNNVISCIPGVRTLYVVFDRSAPSDIELVTIGASDAPSRTHVIEVRFDGPDLDELLGRIGSSAFFARLPELTLSARFLGFRAGFAYLDGWPAEWAMPRRATSRPVPRGSFAIAGTTAGFYPIDSPGGWNLLGKTDAVLWDTRRQPANLIAAGDEVKIVHVERPLIMAEVATEFGSPTLPCSIRGRFWTIIGPPDWDRTRAGLSPGGAFDPDGAASANLLAGNAPDHPVIECAMSGPEIDLLEPSRVAWFGADCDLPAGSAFDASGTIRPGRIRNGLRGWLAIRPLSSPPAQAVASLQRGGDRTVIGIVPGPHEPHLKEVRCRVTSQLDRIGIRMRPIEPIAIDAPANLLSCGMQFGTVQLHPDGSLVAMGPDHPLTGGYLQPFTVRWDERWKLAQLTPGDEVTFSAT